MPLGAILEKEEEDFLMNSNSLGKAGRNEFYESRLKEPNMPLLETIPKAKKSIKKKGEKKEHDLAKETFRFLRHIDWLCSLARFRSHNSHGLWNLSNMLLSYKKRFYLKAK